MTDPNIKGERDERRGEVLKGEAPYNREKRGKNTTKGD